MVLKLCCVVMNTLVVDFAIAQSAPKESRGTVCCCELTLMLVCAFMLSFLCSKPSTLSAFCWATVSFTCLLLGHLLTSACLMFPQRASTRCCCAS